MQVRCAGAPGAPLYTLVNTYAQISLVLQLRCEGSTAFPSPCAASPSEQLYNVCRAFTTLSQEDHAQLQTFRQSPYTTNMASRKKSPPSRPRHALRSKPALPAAAGPRPRCSLRLEQTPAPTTAPSEAANRVTKSTPKAPKPKPQKYDCSTCDRSLVRTSFPKDPATDKCDHEITICKQCTTTWITTQLDSTTHDKLSCPECDEGLSKDDVKRLATEAVSERYDELHRRGKA